MVCIKESRPAIGGKDYSVYSPLKVKLGLRLWTEAYVRALRERAVKPAPAARENAAPSE